MKYKLTCVLCLNLKGFKILHLGLLLNWSILQLFWTLTTLCLHLVLLVVVVNQVYEVDYFVLGVLVRSG